MSGTGIGRRAWLQRCGRAAAFAVGLAALGTLGGCAAAPSEPAAMKDMGDDVLVVVRFDLVPAIRPGEQARAEPQGFPTFGKTNYYTNRIWLTLGDKPVVDAQMRYGAVNAELGRTSFLKVPRGKRYITFSRVVFETGEEGRFNVQLRLPAVIDMGFQPQDKAVYLGTIRIHRDEFYGVTDVEVLDQYVTAALDVRKRYPDDPPIRKSLARFVR